MISHLTTLARARAWAGVTTSNDDSAITSLIAEVSRFILNYLGKPTITSTHYTDVVDGQDNATLLLRHWPVTSIVGISINDVGVSEAKSANASGFVLEPWDGMPAGFPQKLSLRGGCFTRGYSNVRITYNAGYALQDELRTVPITAPFIITANAPYGSFAIDEGVTYANGSALTKVTSAPVQAQYAESAGVYTFSSLDVGAQLLLNYSYIPADIEHACVALVAERYRYRSRIGEISKSLGGQESMSYSQKDMPEFVRTLLQPYRRVLPN